MFGVTLRVGLTAAAMPLFAAVLGRLLEELIPLFGAAHQDTILASAFMAVSNNALLIGLLSALVWLLARSVTESEVRP